MAEQAEQAFGVDAPLHEVMRTMLAMRRLKPDPVPRELLEQMVMGDAPADMLDAKRRERLLEALRFQRDHFHETPAVIVACYDNSNVSQHLRSRWKQVLEGGRELGPRFGAMLAKNSPRAGAMAEAGSVYPGVQNLLLTARALGLAAALTTWHLFFEDEFKRVLGIPKGVHTFALIPVGYPRGNFGPVRRRPAAEAIHWEGW